MDNEQEYEVFYLDDNNTKHLSFIKNLRDLEFIKERFTVLAVNNA